MTDTAIPSIASVASGTSDTVLGVKNSDGTVKRFPLNTLAVSYAGTGTGAVSRTLKAKAEEIERSVIDFGADPTGVADSTTAFNNALAASRRVHVPSGTYKVTNLVLTRSCVLFGDDRYSTTINITTTNQHGIQILGNDTEGGDCVIQVENLTFHYSGAGQDATHHGMVISRRCLITNVSVDNFTNDGVRFMCRTASDNGTAAFFCVLTRVQASNAGQDGISVRAGANANIFIDCIGNNCGRYGIHHDTGRDDGVSGNFATYGNIFIGGQGAYNAQNGVRHDNGTDCQYIGVYGEGNGRSGGTGYVNTNFDFYFSNNSDRCLCILGTVFGGSALKVRAPNRGTLESFGCYLGGRRLYGAATGPAPLNEANAGQTFDQATAAPSVSNVSTANATDLASCITLANQLKSTLNTLMTNMRTGNSLS